MIAVLAGCLGPAGPAWAVVIGQTDTFENGTVSGWGPDFAGVASIAADAGPDGPGDFALLVTSHGDPTQGRIGSRSISLNRSQWTGDWTAAGMTAVAFDARNPNPFPIELWLGIAGPGGAGSAGSGDTYASLGSAAIPAASGWGNYVIDVTGAGGDPLGRSGAPGPAGDPPAGGRRAKEQAIGERSLIAIADAACRNFCIRVYSGGGPEI